MKQFAIIFFLFANSIFLRAQETTETIYSSASQNSQESCSYVTQTCQYNQGSNEISFVQGTPANGPTITNGRYLFNHPNVKNSEIKKVILQLTMRKIYNSTQVDAIMRVLMPYNSCNNTISWSNPNYSNLYSCNKNGSVIFQDGIGTGNTSDTTFNLMIYDRSSGGFSSQTMANADPNSNAFTIAFDPFVGGLIISSVNAIITYDCPALNTPTLNNVNVISSSSLNLNWTSVAGANGYEIYNCTTNQLVATTSSTSYNVTGLSSNTTYSYKVRAKSSCGRSSFSACKSATTSANNTQQPQQPNPLTFTVLSSSRVRLNWASTNFTNSYEIFDASTNLLKITTSNASYTLKNLNSGQTYSFKVRSKNNNGISAFSNTITFNTNGFCPDLPAPQAPTVIEKYANSVFLEWNQVTGAEYYEIYDNNNYIIGQSYVNNFTADQPANTTKTYFVKAKTYCFDKSSPLSSGTVVTTNVNDGIGCESPLLNPPNIWSVPKRDYMNKKDYALISWTKVPSAKSYAVYDSDSKKYMTSTSGTAARVDLLNLNQQYNFYVVASNDCGSSPDSNVIFTGSYPNLSNHGDCYTNFSQLQPSQPTVSVINGNYVVKTVETTGFDDYHEIYCCENGQKIGETSSGEFVVPRNILNPNQTYSFKVRAVNTCSNGTKYYSQFSTCSSPIASVCNNIFIDIFNMRVIRKSNSILFSFINEMDYVYEIYNASTNQLLGTTVNGKVEISNLSPQTEYSLKFKRLAFQACNLTESDVYPFRTLGCVENMDIVPATLSFMSGYRQVSNSITIANISNQVDRPLLIKAQNEINLLPGTTLSSGLVELKIENCVNPSARLNGSENLNGDPKDIVEEVEESYVLVDNKIDNIIYSYKIEQPINDLKEISVYPVPVKDVLTIKSGNEFKGGNIYLYSITNEVVLTKKIENDIEFIDMTNFKSGVYFLKCINDDLKSLNKIIKI
jgi:hypothetical protein